MTYTTSSYYTLDGEIIGESTGGVRVDYQVDALGSVTGHIDQAGVSINKARYKPYGTLLSGTQYTIGWCGALGYRTKSTLKSADVYVRARTYSTKIGQWGTRDGFWPHQRPYAYSKDSPATRVDPSGAKPCGEEHPCAELGRSLKGACYALMCSLHNAVEMFDALKSAGELKLSLEVEDLQELTKYLNETVRHKYSPDECCEKIAKGPHFPSLEWLMKASCDSLLSTGKRRPCFLLMKTQLKCYRCCELSEEVDTYVGICKRHCDIWWGNHEVSND